MKGFIYSNHPMQAYRLINTEQCEVSAISQIDRATATWNLFWLSVPAIDAVVAAGPNWPRVYMPQKGVASAITLDVIEDEVLYRKLLLHPSRFAEWFSREKDHSVFDTYEAMEGPSWVETVLLRANLSSARMSRELPTLKVMGNVIYPIFGKKVA